MEAKFEKAQYSAEQARAVLTFETESVPLQQFQARCAEHVLSNCYTHGGGALHKARTPLLALHIKACMPALGNILSESTSPVHVKSSSGLWPGCCRETPAPKSTLARAFLSELLW